MELIVTLEKDNLVYGEFEKHLKIEAITRHEKRK